jgi:hypothetical protein
MDKTTVGHVSSHHLFGALVRVHVFGLSLGLGRLLPVPLGSNLILSHSRLALVHHGLDIVAHCTGNVGFGRCPLDIMPPWASPRKNGLPKDQLNISEAKQIVNRCTQKFIFILPNQQHK